MGNVAPSYKGFRFPAEIISHCAWLYHRFPLSFREVEEMMLQRGVVVSHETILYWDTAIGIQDLGGLPLGVLMAESGDRNALAQGAVSSCKPTA